MMWVANLLRELVDAFVSLDAESCTVSAPDVRVTHYGSYRVDEPVCFRVSAGLLEQAFEIVDVSSRSVRVRDASGRIQSFRVCSRVSPVSLVEPVSRAVLSVPLRGSAADVFASVRSERRWLDVVHGWLERDEVVLVSTRGIELCRLRVRAVVEGEPCCFAMAGEFFHTCLAEGGIVAFAVGASGSVQVETASGLVLVHQVMERPAVHDRITTLLDGEGKEHGETVWRVGESFARQVFRAEALLKNTPFTPAVMSEGEFRYSTQELDASEPLSATRVSDMGIPLMGCYPHQLARVLRRVPVEEMVWRRDYLMLRARVSRELQLEYVASRVRAS